MPVTIKKRLMMLNNSQCLPEDVGARKQQQKQQQQYDGKFEIYD